MRDGMEFTLYALLIGGGATVAMDLWTVLLKRFGIQSLDLGLLELIYKLNLKRPVCVS